MTLVVLILSFSDIYYTFTINYLNLLKNEKIVKILLKNEAKLKQSNGYEVLDIGFQKNLQGGCGSSDADRMCASWCPTNGCRHDGVCGSGYFDW